MLEGSKYLLNERTARELRGKTMDRIERIGDGVAIYFTDGTAVEISGDRPQAGRILVYIWKPATELKDQVPIVKDVKINTSVQTR